MLLSKIKKDELIAADVTEVITQYYTNFAELGLKLHDEKIVEKNEDMEIIVAKAETTQKIVEDNKE